MMPLTSQQVIEVFGNPAPFVRDDGSVGDDWVEVSQVYITLPAAIPFAGQPGLKVRRLRVHRLVAPQFTAAFGRLYAEGRWGLLVDCAGAYCWRAQRLAPSSRSRHSWGIAVDLNAADNPFMAPPKMPREVVAAFESNGFEWGGRWQHRPDGMHFEFADLGRLGR